MTQLSFFIAAHNGAEYPALLKGRLQAGVEYTIATTVEDSLAQYNGQPVLLARPDFATAILDKNPPVKWIQSTWAGVTPLIKHPFKNYTLTGVKDVFGEQMAEYVLGHILHHELRIEERDLQQRDKIWKARGSGRLQGKTMGVLGTGSIGVELANTVKGFGVRVLGYNYSGKAVEPFEEIYTGASLLDLLQESDYIVGILPDLPGTTNLINDEGLRAMKKSALLINVGRGNLIDDDALCTALDSNQIAGAVLDVFKEEPLPDSSPLWTAKNLKITPHIAAMSYPKDIAEVFLTNLQRYLGADELLYQVDFEKGY